MQKSAENCRELGIGKILQEFCGMLKLISHALLLAEARGGGFKRSAHSAGPLEVAKSMNWSVRTCMVFMKMTSKNMFEKSMLESS